MMNKVFELNKIRAKFIYALLSIILISLVSQIIIQYFLFNAREDSHLVNKAGRQRMLSQRIAKDIYKILYSESEKAINVAMIELKDSIQLWNSSHEELMESNLIDALIGYDKELYSTKIATLSANQNAYSKFAQQIIPTSNPNSNNESNKLEQLGRLENEYLERMNEIVYDYARISEQKVKRIQQIELGLFLLILVSIVLELIFVLFPTFLKIQGLFQNEFELNKKLQERSDSLQKATKIKSEFLSAMSHEMKTPLQTIMGMTDLIIESEGLEGENHKNMLSLKVAGDKLFKLIDKVFDISRLRNEHSPQSNEILGLRSILNDIETEFLPIALEKNLKLVIHIDQKIPHEMRGNKKALSQVLTYLVDNAVKFTEEGEVKISVTCEHRSADNIEVLFIVSDSGIGISPKYHEMIFEEFSQVDNSSTRKHGGAGLGLAICKSLVEEMGGYLKVVSEPQRGSSFIFRLNLEVNSETEFDSFVQKKNEEKLPPLKTTLNSSKILLVDDDENNRLVFSKYLSKSNISFDIASDATEAIQMRTKTYYPLILMDMQMEGVDGFSAVRKIREFEQTNGTKSSFIAAFTAYSDPAELEKTLKAGCNDFITKPIKKQDFIEKINSYLRSSKIA